LKFALQISPPESGATIIPTYVSADESVIHSPLDGAIAYDYVSAPAITADTNFSTTLGAFTAADGTASGTVTNSGLNYELSASSVPPAGTPVPGVMYGREFVFSTPIDLSEQKILIHLYPIGAYASVNAQPFASAGVAVGVRSASGSNYKIWAIAGSDTPNIHKDKYAPYVVGVDQGNTIASNGTLAADSVVGLGLWISTTLTTSINNYWLATSLWSIGTVTVSGGSANYPITLYSLANAVSETKMRETVRFRGDSQAFIYQPVIIGSGGSNPVYCKLDAASIEFPQQYSAEDSFGSFIVEDNWVGLLYNPGQTDTIQHTNSIITSQSRFHWGLHTDASTSASYDFTRLSVIGAGTVTLNKAITIDRLILKDYSTLDVSGATLINCTIADTPTISDSVTLSSTTVFSGCTIDVSRVSSGNRWLSIADPSAISDCSFTGGGGHALRLTTPGSYSFSGNIFSGFGADGSDGAAIYNDSGGEVTLNIAGGGGTPTVKNGSGATTIVQNAVSIVLTNMVSGSSYYIFETDNPTNVYGSGIAAGTTATISTTYIEDTNITVRVRNASGVTKYQPFSTQAELTASGANIYVAQVVDNVA